MKRVIALAAILTLLLVSLTCCAGSQNAGNNKIEVYSFSGGNDTIAVNNGVIILTAGSEKFIGGNITFLGAEPTDIKNYATKFYFTMNGAENIIQSSEGVTTGTQAIGISPDLGSTSAAGIQSAEAWDALKNSLQFSINGTTMNGDNFTYQIPINVKEVFGEEN
jgi:hypothetical protein